jgi:hypothetical protein
VKYGCDGADGGDVTGAGEGGVCAVVVLEYAE